MAGKGKECEKSWLERRFSRPFCNIKFDRNCFKLQTVFGTYCRYTVTATSDGAKLTGATKDKGGEVAAVRIKARYQSVQILPMQAYGDLLAFIKRRYLSLCSALEPALSVKAKEDLATALVRIMHKQQMAKHFLCDLIMSEVDVLDNEHLMFRGNSLATKAMEAYMKLVADEYLQNTLGDFVKALLQCDKDCEVDPLKMPNINLVALEKNRLQLVTNVEAAWCRILNSTEIFPFELREIFDSLRRRLEEIGRLDLADTLISSSIFLRFLCPAILSPSLFNLVSEYPSGRAARNLTLVAKTLQTLANFTKFGGKEHYMDFMNEFVEREWDNMHRYLIKISSLPQNLQRNFGENGWNVAVDVGKELSLLHSYLDELWTPEVHEQALKFDLQMAELRMILAKLRYIRMRNDGIGECEPCLIENPISDYDNTIILRPNACNNGSQFPPHVHNTVSESHVLTKATPATHLNTSDDYVLDIALLNDSLAVRQAGLTVQKNRNGQHRNQRQVKENASCERYSRRNPYTLSDISASHERIMAFDSSKNNAVPEYGTLVSSKILHSSAYSSGTTGGYHPKDETDSDDTNVAAPLRSRHTRPPRKGKRRTAVTTDREQISGTYPDTVTAPSSSGYHSQNQSSSLSSSNSSSPVERTSTQNSHPGSHHPALQVTSAAVFSAHECIPSTSSSSTNSDKLLIDSDRYCVRSAPSTMYKDHMYRPAAHSFNSEMIGVYDVPKCSLPRTNPHCSARNAGATAGTGVNVIKPTLFDISNNDEDSEVLMAMPARSHATDDNTEVIKECGTKWCFSEQRSSDTKQWSRKDSHTPSQQEIIEQQKREIRRLMKENEELKRCVAAQQLAHKEALGDAKIIVKHNSTANGYASEESYDSLGSSNDVQASNNKAVTHC